MNTALPRVERLGFIDALRGLAALWVVLFHFVQDDQFRSAAQHLPAGVVDWVFLQGHLGVWVFFVVSGFVMALAVESRPLDAGAAVRLIARRLMRLAPPYYVSIAFVLALAAVRWLTRHGPVPWPGLPTVASHLVFAEGFFGQPALNVVYWTLTVELQFYVAFAALMWGCDRLAARLRGRGSARAVRLGVIGFVSLVSLLWPLGVVSADRLPMFVAFWHAFLAGVLSFRSVRHGRAERIALGVWVVLLFVAAGLTHGTAPVAVACTALAIAVVGATQRLQTALDWRPLRFAGTVSYSLYLLHDPFVSIVGWVTRRTMAAGVWRDVVGLSASLLASLAAATLLWWLVERPSQRWSRRMRP